MHPEIVSVSAETDQEECARLMERYNLRHLPVLDHEERLIGIIQLEDVVEVVTEEATEDMYRIAGITGERVMDLWRAPCAAGCPGCSSTLGLRSWQRW